MKRTNLLFIYTDEQSFNTLAAYGNEQIEMPHLNRLAAASSVFEKAYITPVSYTHLTLPTILLV